MFACGTNDFCRLPNIEDSYKRFKEIFSNGKNFCAACITGSISINLNFGISTFERAVDMP